MAHIRFDEDIEQYDPSDSDTEYTEKEKGLLKKVRDKRATYSDSEEEVLGLQQQSSDESDIAESDIEGQGDDDLPDVRAWGKDKRAFFSTDYVDPDYGGYQGKDAISAELEEEEASSIQKRLAEQLDDDDFTLDIFNKKAKDLPEKDEELIKSDLSSLTKRQLLDLLRKESPEFFSLLEDYKGKMNVTKEYLIPIIELDKKGNIPHCKAFEFVKTYYQLVLNYCTNINMYLLLKASKVNVQHHPVVKRLYQYRQLIAQLEPVFVEIVKPQLDIIIEANREKSDEENINETATILKKKRTKKLKLLKNLDKEPSENKIKTPQNGDTSDKSVKSILKIDKKNKEKKLVSFESITDEIEQKNTGLLSNEDELETEDKDEATDEVEQSEDAKRAITYQMAKNKGLTPHRKKEQRNPRVKHRNKYRKAKIRRKGAVREVRKELTRYGGEISGIKASVSKSIKIK